MSHVEPQEGIEFWVLVTVVSFQSLCCVLTGADSLRDSDGQGARKALCELTVGQLPGNQGQHGCESKRQIHL